MAAESGSVVIGYGSSVNRLHDVITSAFYISAGVKVEAGGANTCNQFHLAFCIIIILYESIRTFATNRACMYY